MKQNIIILLCLMCTSLIQAQSFEEYKRQQEAEFSDYKQKEKEAFEAFKKQETNWNTIVLGKSQEPAIVDITEEEVKAKNIVLPEPEYVNENANLKEELAALKLEIEKLNKEAATKKLVNTPEEPKIELKPKVEMEAPKQDANVIITKAPTKVVEVAPTTETEIKASLYEKEKRSIPSINPIQVKYRESSPFGYRFHPIHKKMKFHSGIDMACPTGTPIQCPADGTIEYAGWVKGYGNFIKVRHGNGYISAYGHLSVINVKTGQKVSQKQMIGKVGTTGGSTGPHLHYEVAKSGKKVNPKRYM